MSSYSCYIVDDEPLAIEVLVTYIKRLTNIELSGFSTTPVKALQEINELQPDVLFLDIEMPGLGGLELIKTLRNPPAVIITTAYRDYAVEGFELNALDYLVKPIAFERFLQALNKFEELSTQKNNRVDFLLVRANRKQMKIKLKDILFIEGLKDYVKIRMEQTEILTKSTLTDLYQQLDSDQFIRVHKSFIVAKEKITAFSTSDVEIGTIEIPIGRTYKEEFVKRMERQ